MLPHVSGYLLRRELTEMYRTLLRYTALVTIACTLVVVPLLVFSAPLVKLILRGTEVTEPMMQNIIVVQNLSLLQVPFVVALAVGIRVLSATQENRNLYSIAILSLFLTALLDWLFAAWIDVTGIALAGAVVRLICVVYVLCKIIVICRTTEMPAPHWA